MRIWAALAAGVGLSLALAGGAGSSPEDNGADLARRLGCFACHSLRGQGGKEAAPLDGVGARLSRPELAASLSHPRQRHPGARMPSYEYLRPDEKQAMLDFLQGLK